MFVGNVHAKEGIEITRHLVTETCLIGIGKDHMDVALAKQHGMAVL